MHHLNPNDIEDERYEIDKFKTMNNTSSGKLSDE